MKGYVKGRCFFCDCVYFRCPQCGEELRLLDVVDEIHQGLCSLCGPMDRECASRGEAPRDNILGA